MRYHTLGSAGTLVSELCLGTMTFGKETGEAEAHAQLDRFREAGGNFVDTADVYQRGVAEEIVGRWLEARGNRDGVVVATKARFRMAEDPNHQGLSRLWLHTAVEASLRRLRTDRIDLYQAHCFDPLTPVEETVEALDDLVRSGKVRYIGVSNFTGWQLQRAILVARYGGHAPIATLQPQYNLLERVIEWELVPLCLDEGVGILPWSPLGGGWLTGKYRRGEQPAGATRLGEDPEPGAEGWSRRNTDRVWAVVEEVVRIAETRGASPGQVALRWLMDRPGVTSTILGARTAAQLTDNLGACGLRLDDAETARLDEVSDPGLPAYPYAWIEEESGERRDLLV